MNAHDMVQLCFRHQHPEAYGRAEPADAQVPTGLRYGHGDGLTSDAPVIPEEPMGNGETLYGNTPAESGWA